MIDLEVINHLNIQHHTLYTTIFIIYCIVQVVYCFINIFWLDMARTIKFSFKTHSRHLVYNSVKRINSVTVYYFFEYLVCGACYLVILCKSLVTLHINDYLYLSFQILYTVSIYSMTIFLIKRYSYKNGRNENRLSILLSLCMYIYIFFILIYNVNDDFDKDLIFVKCDYPIMYLLNANFIEENPSEYRTLSIVFRLIPILVLTFMWYKSITKSYNNQNLNFFTKSLNRPIFSFLVYNFIMITIPFINFTSYITFVLFGTLLLFNKLLFLFSIFYHVLSVDSIILDEKMERVRRKIKWHQNAS